MAKVLSYNLQTAYQCCATQCCFHWMLSSHAVFIQISASEKASVMDKLKSSRGGMSESEVDVCDYYKVLLSSATRLIVA